MYGGTCFPILPEVLGELTVDTEIVASRHKSMVTLRLNKHWRIQNGLNCDAVYTCCCESRCCSSDTLSEVICYKCAGHTTSGKVIALFFTETAPTCVANDELYSFYIVSRCSSSRTHLGVSSVCLVVVMRGFRVVSKPFQLRSRLSAIKRSSSKQTQRTQSLQSSVVNPSPNSADSSHENSPPLVSPSSIGPSRRTTNIPSPIGATMKTLISQDQHYISSPLSVVVRMYNMCPQVPPVVVRGFALAFTLPVLGRLTWRIRRLHPYPGEYPSAPILSESSTRIILSVCCYDTLQHAKENMPRVELFRGNLLPGFQLLSGGTEMSCFWSCIALFTSW